MLWFQTFAPDSTSPFVLRKLVTVKCRSILVYCDISFIELSAALMLCYALLFGYPTIFTISH